MAMKCLVRWDSQDQCNPVKWQHWLPFPISSQIKQPRRLWRGTYWHEKWHYSTKSRCTHRGIATWQYSHFINSWRVRSCNHLLHILFVSYRKYWSLLENNVHWTNSSKCYHKIFRASNYQCYVEQTCCSNDFKYKYVTITYFQIEGLNFYSGKLTEPYTLSRSYIVRRQLLLKGLKDSLYNTMTWIYNLNSKLLSQF